jgi:putative copper export protein
VPWLATSIQLLHLIGAGGWLGSLALLTVLAIPAARRLDAAETGAVDARIAGLVRAFSPTALAFAALLATTGTVTAWRHLGGLLPLWQSSYGRTLLLKLGFLSIVLAAGVYNWRRVRPALGEPHATVRLRRSSLVELTAAFLVVVVTAVLVASPMPGE